MEPKTKLELYNHFFDPAKKDYGYFYAKFIEPLIDKGMLEFLYPDKPKSKFQKIKTSEKNYDVLVCWVLMISINCFFSFNT